MTNEKIVTLNNLTIYNNKIQNKIAAIDNSIVAIDNSIAILDTGGDGNSYLANDGTYKTITIPEYSPAYPIVYHTVEETTLEMTSNTLHIWDEVSTLDLTLVEGDSSICNEYVFQFGSGENPTTLILPDTISWVNGIPEIESNKIYQCSILNNIAVICGV